MDSLAVESSTSFVAERGAILADIDLYLRKLINLKTHLNTFTRINRLPSEVLAQILVVYVRDHYRSATSDKSIRTSPQWIKLAHVCRHWRDVALGTPRFWSHLYVRKPETFSALLPLSKSSPLYIDLKLDQDSWADPGAWISATERIEQQSHRLRELRYVAISKHVRRLAEKLSPPMPLLERLVLWYWGSPEADSLQPLRLLPATGHTPRLRYLELRNVPVAWTDPVFCPTLTTLVVFSHAAWRAGSGTTGTFDQLMDALQAMAPSLGHLTLEQSVPPLQSPTTEPPPPNRSIALTSLQSLRILCNTNDCVRLMDHLSVSPGAKIDITGHGAMGIQRLVEILSAHVSRSAPLLGLNICFPHSMSKVTITGYRDVKHSLHPDSGPAIHLTLDTSETGGAQERPLTAVLKAAKTLFSRVQTLSMSSRNGYDVSWLKLFVCAYSVETLDLIGHPGNAFFKALCDLRQIQTEQTSGTFIPLLRLRELKLDDVRFRDSIWSSERGDGVFSDQLLDWAILRCNYQVPLERLQIRGCKSARAKDIRRIREVIVEVKWDEWERESTDEDSEDDDDDDDDDLRFHLLGW